MTILLKDDFSLALKHVIDALDSTLDKRGRIAYDSNSTVVTSDNTMTRMLQTLAFSGAEELLSKMFIDSCAKLSIYGDMSARIHAQRLVKSSKAVLALLSTGATARYVADLVSSEHELAMKELNEISRRVTTREIYELLKLYSPEPVAIEMITEAMKLAGITSKIIIEKSSGHSIVEKLNGNSFVLAPVLPGAVLSSWQQKNVRCIIIDGVIDNVSEIHNILQKSHETSQPIAFFCRGYSADVLNTFVANRLRKTLNVHAVGVPYDMRHANTLADIAIICGCDVVSSLKGDVISTKRLETFPVVDRVSINASGNVVISNSSTQKAVDTHARYLMTQRSNAQIGDIADAYDGRIKSLNSSSVIVRVGGHTDSQRMFEHVDSTLKMARAIMKSGMIHATDAKFDGRIVTNMLESSDLLPTIVLATSHYEIASFVRSVCCAAGVVLRD